MKYKKPIYYIMAIFILISIATSPVIAENLNINQVANEKSAKQNNIVVVKAATSNESINDTNSFNDSNTSTNTNSTINNESTNKTNSTVGINSENNSNNQNNPTNGKIKPKKLTQVQILKASIYINNYVTKYKKLPNKVNIGGYNFSIPEYTYLLNKLIYYKYNKKNTDIIIKYDVKNPKTPMGTKIKGKLTTKQFYTYAKNIIKYIDKNNRVPNYVTTKIGKIQYQTAVYGFNKILYWSHYHKNKLPSSLTLNIAKNNKINKVIPTYTKHQNFNILPSDNNDNKNFTIIKAKYSCGPTEVKYNHDYLISTGKCSCGKYGDYLYHSSSFKNYCPYCKKYGCMIYEDGTTSPEGMWVCTKCDADFCLVCGKEHIIKNPKYLTAH